MDATPVETFHERVRDRRPAELPVRKALRQQAYAYAIKPDQLDPVGALRPEDVDHAIEGIGPHRLAHQRGQALSSLAEVDRLRRHHNAHRAGRSNHDAPFSAPIAAAILAGEAPFSIVTFTPSTSSAIAAPPRRAVPRPAFRHGGFTGSASVLGAGLITAGTNAGVSAALWASRRQVMTWCGVKPCRRATADTTAPGMSVSSRIRARSSDDLRRRIMELGCRWSVDQTIIEDTDIGRAINQDLRRAGEYSTILHPVRIDKESRLLAQSARFEAGQVHVPENAPWLAEWMNELLAFPNGRQDDQVDSTSQALHYLTRRMPPVVEARTPQVRPHTLKRPTLRS
jgi:predicted phage terminase large subunit-like protein